MTKTYQVIKVFTYPEPKDIKVSDGWLIDYPEEIDEHEITPDELDLAAGVTELRKLYEELIADSRRRDTETYCAYCGIRYPLDDQAATLVSEHIHTCEKHPMREVERQVAELRHRLEQYQTLIDTQQGVIIEQRQQIADDERIKAGMVDRIDRLEKLHNELNNMYCALEKQLAAITEQRDALLEAARAVVAYHNRSGVMAVTVICVKAAIALCDKAAPKGES
jgi:DNA repair exonuclease SbcCD ATPase subunit